MSINNHAFSDPMIELSCMFSALRTEYVLNISRFEEMQWPRISFISIRNGWTITRGEASDLNILSFLFKTYCLDRNFTQFYSTKSERDKNLRKEYDNQMEYRKHLQAFIDRWRYNANRGWSINNLSDTTGSHSFFFSCTGSIQNQDFGEGEI